MRKSYVAAGLLLVAICACLWGCEDQRKRPAECLTDLAYFDGAEESRYTILVPEGDALVPYLVLTADYNGNCLLLRKHLLPESRIYNRNGNFAAYYENSLIDQWLNTEFCETLAEPVRDLLVDSRIEITARDSLRGGEETVITIEREIFILSSTEVSKSGFRTVAREGEWLEYFTDIERRMASKAGAEAFSWWLRSPNLWDDNVVCGVDSRGCIGIGGVGSAGAEGEYKNGVRPAFCLSGDTVIYTRDGQYYLMPVEETGP